MSYDKYQNWPLPSKSGNIFSVMQRRNIEEQVLKDLVATDDEIDKLEILDSYAAYAQRVCRQEFAEGAAQLTGQQLVSVLAPFLLSRLPEISPLRRARPAQAKRE